MKGTNSWGSILAKTLAQLPTDEVNLICAPDTNVLAKTLTV